MYEEKYGACTKQCEPLEFPIGDLFNLYFLPSVIKYNLNPCPAKPRMPSIVCFVSADISSLHN
jgi:hypothetical protein